MEPVSEKQQLLQPDGIAVVTELSHVHAGQVLGNKRSFIPHNTKTRLFALLSVSLVAFYGIPALQSLAISSNVFPGSDHHVAESDVATAKQGRSLCLSPACIHASSEILYNMSPNYKKLDPCTDEFEELVCGGWRDRHDLRADQGDAFTGTIMAENSATLLRHILEAGYPSESQHSYFSPMRLLRDPEGGKQKRDQDEANFDLMKAAYDACIDEEGIKKLGLVPLGEVLANITSIFPTAVSSSPNTMDSDAMRDAVLYLAQLGVSALISPGTGADDRDPDVIVVSVSPPWSFGLPSKERYEDKDLVEAYTKVVGDVMSALVTDRDRSVFDKVVEFEGKLAKASPSTEEREDVTKYYNPLSLSDASALAPQLDLAAILSALAPPHAPEISRVIVSSPSYMEALSSVLDETPAEVLQSYFLWKATQSLASYVDVDALKPLKRFGNSLAGRDPDAAPERWRTCVAHVDNGLPWLLSRFFVESAFSAEAKAFGDTIVSDIKSQFIEKLKATTWMEPEVIDKAIEKVHNIVQKIGYPTSSPDVTNPGNLAKYYADLSSLDPKHYFANSLALRRFDTVAEWDALGRPTDRARWDMSVPTVNAYYNPPGNEIVFPAGIMQFPVFDVALPAYVSYGAFGSVAGHELSHAFDSTGRHYDQQGNYTDWWTDKTVEAFEKRADCFVKQYANFTVPGPDDGSPPLHVNGRLTLGENIADAGGLSASFQVWSGKKKAEQDLPGLDFFTHEQLFFVSYANWWCGKSRREAAINRIYTDPHAPKWARILGTMANSREFRDSFKCKDKEPVCELW